jgi:tetraacyldisaccharide 4'-kinase
MAAMAAGEAPPFWWKKPGVESGLLWPVAAAWGAVAGWRMSRPASAAAGAPVLCIGNFIIGGAGKTPTALAFAARAAARGLRPGFLSRGYGGALRGIHVVDPKRHSAREVGDEPLLLAASAPCVVCGGNRVAGAALLAAQGCDFVILDDGFQNPGLARDFSLVVVDSRRGIGNGQVFPAGPLRAPLVGQLVLADAVLVIGEALGADRVIRFAARSATPVHHAGIAAVNGAEFSGRKVVAYAGIADPEKFFATLAGCGAKVVARRSFADHHPFNEDEAEELLQAAAGEKARLVTTSKDFARLGGGGDAVRRLAKRSSVLRIDIAFEDEDLPDRIIDAAIASFEANRFRRRR